MSVLRSLVASLVAAFKATVAPLVAAFKAEPVVVLGAAASVVVAVVHLISSGGFTWAAVAPLIAGFLARFHVTPVAKISGP